MSFHNSLRFVNILSINIFSLFVCHMHRSHVHDSKANSTVSTNHSLCFHLHTYILGWWDSYSIGLFFSLVAPVVKYAYCNYKLKKKIMPTVYARPVCLSVG